MRKQILLNPHCMHVNNITIYSATHPGLRRRGNEDAHAYCADIAIYPMQWQSSGYTQIASSGGSLLILADGMGGANAGEVASALAVGSIQEYITSHSESPNQSNVREILKSALLNAHKVLTIHQHEHRDTIGMGTTLVVAWVYNHYAAVAWIGDSRAYKYNNHFGLTALTKDHSMVQKLIDMGELTVEEAFSHPNHNIITQFVGDRFHTPHPDFNECMIGQDDLILLCSDGLTGMIREHQISNILEQPDDLVSKGDHLIEVANKSGGDDNITLILWNIEY